MGSWLIGSFGLWYHFFQDIQDLFVIHTQVRSVNGIIRVIGSVCLGPKVIPLSGAHCTRKFENPCLKMFYFIWCCLNTEGYFLITNKRIKIENFFFHSFVQKERCCRNVSTCHFWKKFVLVINNVLCCCKNSKKCQFHFF